MLTNVDGFASYEAFYLAAICLGGAFLGLCAMTVTPPANPVQRERRDSSVWDAAVRSSILNDMLQEDPADGSAKRISDVSEVAEWSQLPRIEERCW